MANQNEFRVFTKTIGESAYDDWICMSSHPTGAEAVKYARDNMLVPGYEVYIAEILWPIPGERPISDYGDLMELDAFICDCLGGNFIDYDGYGYYSDGKNEWPSLIVKPSDIIAGRIDPRFTHVLWFNR